MALCWILQNIRKQKTGDPLTWRAIITGGKLVFVAATMDNHLRAFNSEMRELLSVSYLPASAQDTPMNYMVNGKQFVIIASLIFLKFVGS